MMAMVMYYAAMAVAMIAFAQYTIAMDSGIMASTVCFVAVAVYGIALIILFAIVGEVKMA